MPTSDREPKTGISSPREDHYLVAASQKSFYVRVIGMATMTNSAGLQEVLADFRGRGFRRFIFDLGECTGIDSTFMGTMLGVAMEENVDPGGEERPSGADVPVTVDLVNASSYLTDLITGVGIDRVLRLHSEPVELPRMDLRRLQDLPQDPMRRIRSMVAAHENLVRLGGSNLEKFGAMLDALRRELGEDPDPN